MNKPIAIHYIHQYDEVVDHNDYIFINDHEIDYYYDLTRLSNMTLLLDDEYLIKIVDNVINSVLNEEKSIYCPITSSLLFFRFDFLFAEIHNLEDLDKYEIKQLLVLSH